MTATSTNQTTAPPTDTQAAGAVGLSTGKHTGLAILALALGGFTIGTTEFLTMGVLPEIAAGVDVSVPAAGRVIAAYALGVVVGVPILAFFGAGLPRRAMLVGLMAAYAVFNVASALAPGYGVSRPPASSTACRTARTSVSRRWSRRRSWPPNDADVRWRA